VVFKKTTNVASRIKSSMCSEKCLLKPGTTPRKSCSYVCPCQIWQQCVV